MTRSYLCFLALAALLATGCSSGFNPKTLVGTAPNAVPLLESGALQKARLRELGLRDLACADLTIERSHTLPLFRVRGCGKGRLYVRLSSYGPAEADQPAVALEVIDFEPLTARASAGHRRQGNDESASLVRLNEQGAIDLACPREEVVPQMTLSGFLPGYRGRHGYVPGPPIYASFAEGCGRRATYVIGPTDPFVLMGKIDAPDAPTGFEPWDGAGERAR